MKPVLLLLFLFPAIFSAQNYQYLGDFDSAGTPLYLEPNDVVSKETLEMINNSLPESYPVPDYNPHYISSGYDTDIILNEQADVYVTFVKEGAGYKNVLGFYTYNLDTKATKPNPEDITIIFPNVSEAGYGGNLRAGNKVKIGTFGPNIGIGWVLLANGWNGSQVTSGLWQLHSNPDFNPEANADLRYHNVLLSDPENERVILGFEDIRRDYNSCDNDFNDAIFYISASTYSAIKTRNYADVSSSSKVNSSYDGGLESNGDLATLIAKRNLNRSKKGNLKNKKKLQNVFKAAVSNQKLSGTKSLESYFPETAMFKTETARVATPDDLIAITNADEVFAIDYYAGDDRAVAALLTKTSGRVYDHTKTICDRLNGSVLEDVRTFRLRNHKLILSKIKRANGDHEYAVSFSVNQSEGQNTLYSYWNIDQYPLGDYLNFQIWGKSVGQVSSIVNYILDQMQAEKPLAVNDEKDLLPEVFVQSGYYENGKLHLDILNTSQAKKIQVTANYRKTENAKEKTQQINTALSGALEETVVIETGFLFDAGISVNISGSKMYDALYLADGPWGVDYNAQQDSVTNFEVLAQKNNLGNDVYNVERSISVDANLKGTLNIFRHILAGELALNIEGYDAVAFDVKSNKPVEVILITGDNKNWDDRLRYTIPADSLASHYAIPFDLFKDASGKSVAIKSVRSVVFSVQGDYVNYTPANIKIENLAFGNERSLSIDNTEAKVFASVKAVAYPNPFVDFTRVTLPNPYTSADITLTDLRGRKVYSAQQIPTGNNKSIIIKRGNLVAGYYVYQIVDNNKKTYTGKIILR